MSTDLVHPAIDRIRQEIDAIGLDVATSYTLADAIREGSRHSEQLHGGYLQEESSCALGAAYLSAKARGFV